MDHRQYSFDHDDDEDDEFMRYYKKFRPQYSNGCGSSRTSSSPNFSQLSGADQARCNSATSSTTTKRGPWYHMKKKLMPKSKSLEERTRPPLRRQPAAAGTTASSSTSSTSPLGGLSGMLSDKMTVSSSSQGDETQSRDSGHSSGGSPDLRGLRRRPMLGMHHNQQPLQYPQQPTRGYTARSSDSVGNWYRQQSSLARQWTAPALSTTSSHYDDANSIYSYETARDYAPTVDESVYDPALTRDSSVYAANNSWDSNSAYSCDTMTTRPPSLYYDSFSEVGSVIQPHQSRLIESWSPSENSVVNKRKLDCLREDSGSFAFTGANNSPRRKRPFKKEDTDVDDLAQRDLNSNGKLTEPNQKTELRVVQEFCSCLWMLLKIVLASISTFLLFFAFLFAYRTYRCESDRQSGFDVDRLASDLASSVYGQSLARTEVARAVREFSLQHHGVSVLVFTGWLGSGKTFVSSLVRDAFPVAENVHSFSVPVHFARENALSFLDELSLHIGRSCGHSLVVFDDVDSASTPAFEQMERFVLTLQNTRLSSRSNGTLVIASSNSGGKALNRRILDLVSKGGVKKREAMDYSDAVQALQSEGAQIPFHHSGVLARSGIPVRVVPFLPLTREHVRQCVWKEVLRQGLRATEQDVTKVLSEVGFFSAELPVLSKTGCKQVAAKVDLHLGGQDPYLHG